MLLIVSSVRTILHLWTSLSRLVGISWGNEWWNDHSLYESHLVEWLNRCFYIYLIANWRKFQNTALLMKYYVSMSAICEVWQGCDKGTNNIGIWLIVSISMSILSVWTHENFHKDLLNYGLPYCLLSDEFCWYKYYVFGHCPSSLSKNTALFMFQNTKFQRLESVSIFR
jgi:hypothetical protein